MNFVDSKLLMAHGTSYPNFHAQVPLGCVRIYLGHLWGLVSAKRQL